MSNTDLPVRTDDQFIAEIEIMDLSGLKDLTFTVGVSQGDRNKCKVLASTLHGPYNFYEMCEEVGLMWKEHQHHAKVTVLVKDRKKATKFLDQNTTDYIEAHYMDIITEGLLGGVFDEQKEYTCQANVVDSAETDGTKPVEGNADAPQQTPSP